VRALFSDVDLHTLRRMANIFDIDGETLARAYRAAARNMQRPFPSSKSLRRCSTPADERNAFVVDRAPSIVFRSAADRASSCSGAMAAATA
jgi:hypothetical protein